MYFYIIDFLIERKGSRTERWMRENKH